MDEVYGTTSRCFDKKGNKISCPYHIGMTCPKEKRPEDYVTIEQYVYKKVTVSPYGEEVEIYSLGNPIKETYIRWAWENETWYPMVTLVIKNNEIAIDRRPQGWNFVEQFNTNRPDLKKL